MPPKTQYLSYDKSLTTESHLPFKQAVMHVMQWPYTSRKPALLQIQIIALF